MKHLLYFRVSWLMLVVVFNSTIMGRLAMAQDPNDGGIPSAEIVILKDRQITLPKADRNFQKIPPRHVEIVKHDLTYRLKNYAIITPAYLPVVKPLKLKDQEIAKLFGNYVTAGFGNYSSPYLEGFFGSKRDRNKMYGAHFYHRSFGSGYIDDANSSSGKTAIDLGGKLMGASTAVGAKLHYEKSSGNFYGYNATKPFKRDTINQHYSSFGIGFDLANAKKSKLDYKVVGGFDLLSDRQSAKENELSILSTVKYQSNAKKLFALNINYWMLVREDSKIEPYTRQLVKLNPTYEFVPIENLTVTAGANVVFQSDPRLDISSFNIFPTINANYRLNQNMAGYASLVGDVDKVSLRSVSTENFWINSNQKLINTKRAFEFTAGVKGQFLEKLFFNAGFSFSSLSNYYFYQSNLFDRSKFDLSIEPGSTKRTNPFVELGTTQEAFNFRLRAEYYNYSRESGITAFHRPSYKVITNSSYNIYNKLIVNFDLFLIGGMKALDLEKSIITDLPAAFDANTKVDYLFSRRVSFFAKIENAFSNNYQLFLNYPVRGLQASIGLSCSF